MMKEPAAKLSDLSPLFLLCSIFALIIWGCSCEGRQLEERYGPTRKPSPISARHINGHDYVVVKNFKTESMAHDPDCACYDSKEAK